MPHNQGRVKCWSEYVTRDQPIDLLCPSWKPSTPKALRNTSAKGAAVYLKCLVAVFIDLAVDGGSAVVEMSVMCLGRMQESRSSYISGEPHDEKDYEREAQELLWKSEWCDMLKYFPILLISWSPHIEAVQHIQQWAAPSHPIVRLQRLQDLEPGEWNEVYV